MAAPKPSMLLQRFLAEFRHQFGSASCIITTTIMVIVVIVVVVIVIIMTTTTTSIPIITIITIIPTPLDSMVTYLKPPAPVEFLHDRDQKGQSLTGACPCFTQNIPTSTDVLVTGCP